MTTTDWERYVEELGDGHRTILQSTLPTVSFKLLLEACITDCNLRLAQLDLGREAIEFKQRYHSIRLQQELAESLLDFVQDLTPSK